MRLRRAGSGCERATLSTRYESNERIVRGNRVKIRVRVLGKVRVKARAS